jgi:hypothetical protein
MPEATFLEVLTSAGFEHTPASAEFRSWLAEVKAPREIVDLLAVGLPARQKRRRRLGDRHDLFTEGEIMAENRGEPRCLRAGLLVIGSCINGDPVALDLRKRIGAVGYVSHENVWGDEGARVRKFFVAVAPSLAEFARLAADRELPVDYYAARRGG